MWTPLHGKPARLPRIYQEKSDTDVSGGNGFRRLERILKVSHVSVINWVKKAGAKLEKVPKKDEKVEALELDKLCIIKKTSGSGPR